MNRPASPIQLAGPSAVRAARRIPFKPEVPFPWDLPPEDSRPVYQSGVIAAPLVGVQTVILQYVVPDGFLFAFKARLNTFQGSGMVIGAPSATWTTDVNSTPGIAVPQGWPVEGMAAETFPVGSLVAGPWPVLGCLVLESLDILRVKVVTDADIAPGVPNYFISAIMGWLYPAR
jgi:hypothetical protein